MTGPRTPEHEWAIRHLPLFAARLLTAEEVRRLNAHIEQCDSCREAWAILTPDSGRELPGEHIPPPILRRWNEEKDQLRGLERELVRRHLESCETCRRLLELRGYTPVLPVVPSLELARELADRLKPFELPAPARDDAPEMRGGASPGELDDESANDPVLAEVIPLRRRPNPWRDRLMGAGVAALATAAAFTAVFGPTLQHQFANRGAPSQQSNASFQIALGIAGGPLDATLGSVEPGAQLTVRGEVQPVTSFVLRPGQNQVRLKLVPPNVAPDQRMKLQLFSESGALMSTASMQWKDIDAEHQGLVLVSTRPFEPTKFQIRLSWTTAEGKDEELNYPIVLRR